MNDLFFVNSKNAFVDVSSDRTQQPSRAEKSGEGFSNVFSRENTIYKKQNSNKSVDRSESRKSASEAMKDDSSNSPERVSESESSGVKDVEKEDTPERTNPQKEDHASNHQEESGKKNQSVEEKGEHLNNKKTEELTDENVDIIFKSINMLEEKAQEKPMVSNNVLDKWDHDSLLKEDIHQDDSQKNNQSFLFLKDFVDPSEAVQEEHVEQNTEVTQETLNPVSMLPEKISNQASEMSSDKKVFSHEAIVFEKSLKFDQNIKSDGQKEQISGLEEFFDLSQEPSFTKEWSKDSFSNQALQKNEHQSLKGFDFFEHKKADVSLQHLVGSGLTQTASSSRSEPSLQPLSSTPPHMQVSRHVTDSKWAPEVFERVQWMGQHSIQKAHIQVNPIDLGPLEVEVQVKDGQATVLFGSQHAAVREALQQALPKLQEMLGEQGIVLSQANISDRSFQSMGGQTGDRGQPSPEFSEDPSILGTTAIDSKKQTMVSENEVDYFA